MAVQQKVVVATGASRLISVEASLTRLITGDDYLKSFALLAYLPVQGLIFKGLDHEAVLLLVVHALLVWIDKTAD